MMAGKRGMNVKGLQYIIGHAQSDMKMDVYKQNFNKIIGTHLLLRGGVHCLTLSGLVRRIKWRFSGLCYFHQASSNRIVFVANGV